ncbi:hypothetical protein ACJX0J_030965, partial [Zea mays]
TARRLMEQTGMTVDEVMRRIQVEDALEQGYGPVHMAASYGNLKVCKFLLKELKLDVNATARDGATPLAFAMYGNASLAIVMLLLDYGANPNKEDKNGIYPLHIAAQRGYYEIAELLLSRGAYVDPQWESRSPLYIAANYGNARIVELLLHHGAQPNIAMKAAISERSFIGLKSLIEAGAPVNIGLPETPLIAAATAGLTDFVKCLVQAGADANIPDDNGRVAVEIAAIQGYQECVEVLFPATAPLAGVADWSIGGLLQHHPVLHENNEPDYEAEVLHEDNEPDYEAEVLHEDNEPDYEAEVEAEVLHDDNEPDYEAEGDATFCKRDYSHALDLYTMAMEIDPDNSTLYAKRSLCFLYTGYEGKALEDATTYRDMQPALALVKVGSDTNSIISVMFHGYLFALLSLGVLHDMRSTLAWLELGFLSKPTDEAFGEGQSVKKGPDIVSFHMVLLR